MSRARSGIPLVPLESSAGGYQRSISQGGSFIRADNKYSPRASEEHATTTNVNETSTDTATSTLLKPYSPEERSEILENSHRSLFGWHLPEGWRFGATLGAGLSLLALITNLVVVVIATVLVRRENGTTSAIAPIRKGNCKDIEHIGLGIHLVINIVSTLLLGASNYCMQCLSAPTREAIDRAHQKGTWLDIGVPSLRNLRFVRPIKLLFWMLLGISSVPLHLLYNSTFFMSLTNNSYEIYYASDTFQTGAPFDEKLFPNPGSSSRSQLFSYSQSVTRNFTVRFPNGSDAPIYEPIYYSTNPATVQSRTEDLNARRNGSYYERLNNSACMEAYAKTILPDRRTLILVASNSPWNNEQLRISYFTNMSGWSIAGFYDCTNSSGHPMQSSEVGLVACADNSSLYAIDQYSNSLMPNRRPSIRVWFSWICSQEDHYMEGDEPASLCSDGYWQTIRSNASQWNVWGFNIDYCISEAIEDQCRLNVATNLLTVVIVFNAVKFVVITVIVWKIRDKPIITVGDAAASFIRQPDETTRGMCLVTKADVTKRSSRFRGLAYRSMGPKQWKPEKIRRASAASKAHWATSIMLTFLALTIILGLLGYAVQILKVEYGRGDLKSLLDTGLGTTSPYTLISGWAVPPQGDGAVVATVLIANVPQALLSILYVIINSLFTSLSLATEWSGYAHRRRALRVSNPAGTQRSTYFLQVPYRLALPLMTFSAFLHWIISQSIFIAKVDGVEADGELQDGLNGDGGTITCGYSPLGMIITVLATVALMAFAGALGARRLRPGMPLVGSCSVAIAAACHAPKGTSERAPVMWGAIPSVEDETDGAAKVGHCAFSNEHVNIPVEGHLYA